MTIPAILQSKKGQALIIGLIALVCQNVLGLSENMTKEIVAMVASYLIGQGIADHGKEAAKVEANKQP